MPRRKTPLVNGVVYHVYNRGVNRQPIFFSPKDYKRALNVIEFYLPKDIPIRYSKFLQLPKDLQEEILDTTKQKERIVDIISYCLMPNHFHLLLKQNCENGIKNFTRNFQISITKYINKRHHRVGPLLQGPFKASLVENDNQILHVQRYIHLNPYTAYIVKNPEDIINYPWSSLGEYLETSDLKICNKKLLQLFFNSKDKLLKFILDQADYQRKLKGLRHLTFE
jgi:putative transposase